MGKMDFHGKVRFQPFFRSYPKEWMIELDRFVHSLSGNENETIERVSSESSATSKHDGRGLDGFVDDIKNRRESGTWCGLPPHLLLPTGYANIHYSQRLELDWGWIRSRPWHGSSPPDGL